MRVETIVKTLGVLAVLAALLVLRGTTAPGALAGNGYAFDDSAPFSWVDACAEGNVLVDISDGDDESQSDVPVGFTFSFGGADYTMVEPTSNGVISLNQEGNTEYDNLEIPTTEWEGAALFPWWDDLDTEEAGQVCAATVGQAPNRAFVVEWDAVADHNIGDADETISFEAVMCESSDNVVFQYLDAVFGDQEFPEKDNAGDASVGIQQTSSNGLQYSFNEAVITDGMAIAFYPTGGSAANCLVAEPTPTATAPAPPPTETPGPDGSVSVTVADETVGVGEDVLVTATVVDGAGNPVEGEECTFEIFSQPGDDAAVEAGPVTTDTNGEAATTLSAGTTPGTVQVEATCGAFTEVIDVTVSPAALPGTGTGGRSETTNWLVLAGALAALGLGALTLRARRS
jgi:hypothetical protein